MDPLIDPNTGNQGEATAQASPWVASAAALARSQQQQQAALMLEQQRAALEQTRNQRAQQQEGRQIAGQTLSSDAAQWASDPSYSGVPYAQAPADVKQHFMDAYATVPGGGNGVAEQIPEAWNTAQRNATGNPQIGLENLQEGQTAQVDMNGNKVSVGKPPSIHTDPVTGKLYKVDSQTGQPTFVQIQDSGAQGPVGNPATGDDFLSTLDPADAAHVKAIAEGRESPDTFSTRNNQRARMAALVQQYDPTADAATLAKRQATVKNFSNGNAGNAIRSGNTAIAHLQQLTDTIPQLNNSGSEWWNDVANPVAKGFSKTSNAAQGRFATEAGIVGDELSKFFGGKGGTTVQAVKEWHDKLNPNAPPETLKGNIQAAIELLAGQMRNYQTQYEEGMGKSKDIPFIYPESQKILDDLQNKGINVGSAKAIDAGLQPQTAPDYKAAAIQRQQGQTQTQQPSIPTVNTKSDYDALPTGTRYMDSNGQTAVKK